MNEYDKKHLHNLTAIERAIQRIFMKAAEDAARIGMRLDAKLAEGSKAFSFTDYPSVKPAVEKLMRQLKEQLEVAVVDGVKSAWTLANNKNDALSRRVFGDNVGKLTPAQYRRYFSTNAQALEAFLARKTEGLSLSDRVWNYTNAFREQIELGLEVGIRSGTASAGQMAEELKQWLVHPDKLFRRVRDEEGLLQLSSRAKAFHPGRGVYRSSYMNARRLAATETNTAYRTADHLRWQQMDFVVGIEISLSNNHTVRLQPGETTDDPAQLRKDGTPKANAVRPLHDICDELKGRYPKSFKFTGWHPHCRCYAVTVLKTDEELDRDTERILDGKEPMEGSANEVKDVPEGFRKWLDDNKERVKYVSSVPYFISDNIKYIPKSFINNIGVLKAGLSAVQAINIKESLLKVKDPTSVTEKEVKKAFTDFATANPSLFNGGLAAVQITRKKSATAFMANRRYYNQSNGAFVKRDGNTLIITNKDFTTTTGDVFNPLHEVKGAIKAITEKTALTFNQEYALESVWHEFRHASAVGWKDIRKKTPVLTNSMEVINQFCARLSYPSFIRGLGGKATHAKKIMEKGYGYGKSVSNFCTLLKQMKVSQKSAYRHFQDLIIKSPYEDIHSELVRFVELRGKYDKKKAEDIVCGLGFLPDAFKDLL